jgi:hypothetical protein
MITMTRRVLLVQGLASFVWCGCQAQVLARSMVRARVHATDHGRSSRRVAVATGE